MTFFLQVSGAFIVFDLDGVLWDGEPLYHEAFNVVLRPRGHVVTPEDYSQIIGNSVENAWAWVLQRFGIEEEPAPSTVPTTPPSSNFSPHPSNQSPASANFSAS